VTDVRTGDVIPFRISRGQQIIDLDDGTFELAEADADIRRVADIA